MPDPNKHAKLEASGFRILPACVTCVHFVETGPWWGRCRKKTYEHLKHGARTVGVPRFGTCNDHAEDSAKTAAIVGDDYVGRYVQK